MNALLVAGWLLASGAGIPDTTVVVQRGDRVVVENLSGAIRVTAWDRGELRVRGYGERIESVGVYRRGDDLVVGVTDPKGRGRDVEVEVSLPAWAALSIRGREVDVVVEGTASELQVQVVEGDVTARRVNGVVTLSTVDGVIEVEDAGGRLTARSRSDDVTLRRIRGEVEAYSGSGDVTLEEIRASTVRAETLDGDLVFRGALARGGTYAFSVHDGDAIIAIPPGSGVRARVATFDGEFQSDFPVILKGYGGDGVFEFSLGDGGAALDVRVFDGEIRLLSSGR